MSGLETELITRIEELQSELNEQCRLLGMSAERELKLIAQSDRFLDGMLTLGTELRAIEVALDDKRINRTHTAAQIAAEMRGKINELHAEIQKLISERNAFGLAIDRALAGIVPDEHPLRSRLVEIAALRAQIEAMKRQEPVAAQQRFRSPIKGRTDWSVWQPCEINSARPAGTIWGCEVEYRELYLAPGAQTAQTAPSVPDGWKSVPVEPTLEMLHAAQTAWLKDPCRKSSTIYRAMIAAAPGTQENNDA